MGLSEKNSSWDQKIARIMVRPLAGLPIHPNAITTLGMLCGLWSGYLFASGDPVLSNWAALVFVFAAFIDHADGEFARLTGKTSTFGHYYDHVGACVSYVAMFVGVGFGQVRNGALEEWGIPLGVMAGLAVAAIMSARLAVEMKVGKEATAQGSFAGFEPEDALYIVAPVAWLGGLAPFLVAAGIGAPLFLFWVVYESLSHRSAP